MFYCNQFDIQVAIIDGILPIHFDGLMMKKWNCENVEATTKIIIYNVSFCQA